MGRLTSDGSVEFTCPKCFRRFAHSVKAIERSPNVHCPHCDALFDYHELEQLRKGLHEEVVRHKLRYGSG